MGQNVRKRRNVMKKKSSMIVVGLAIIVGITVFLAGQETCNAKEARIISIHGGAASNIESIRLEPQELLISKGTVVIWNNWAIASEVKVVFGDGKRCQNSTNADTGFGLDAENRYISVRLEGRTASLRFIEKGIYNYVVETGNQIKERGQIIVD